MKINNHIQAIKLVCKILPVRKIVIETAEFDTQLLKAKRDGVRVPVGTDYQCGVQYGFYNVRQYVLWRDGYACQCCGAHGNGVKLHVHHLESRQTGGNSPDNLITLCKNCHKKLHAGALALPKGKRHRCYSLRDAAFMGIMRRTLLERVRRLFPNMVVCSTFGYVTKGIRESLGIEKSHVNDAFVIAGNLGAVRLGSGDGFLLVPKRCHNRCLHKCRFLRGGIRKANQVARVMFGYCLFDMVLCKGTIGFIFSRRTSGSFAVRHADGSHITESISYKKLRLLEHHHSTIIEQAKLD